MIIFDIIRSVFNSLLVNLGIKKSTKNLKVINNFNLNRFLGTWYEIARYNHWFQKNQIYVNSTYELNKDNTIKVVNFGFILNKNGEITQVRNEGIAKLFDSNNPKLGWLKVSFFKSFYNDYKIIYIDPTYDYMIVTGKSFDFFWILSKKHAAALSEQKFNELIFIAEKFGFNKDKMILTI